MISLGLDISTKTGVVFLDENFKVIHAEEVICKKFEHPMERVKVITDTVKTLMDKYPPDVVTLEGYGYANTHTLVTLVEIGTAIRLMLHPKHTWHEIAPTSLKKVITGKGTAGKDMMLLEVYKRWGYSASTNNIADAYGLAVIGLHKKGVDVTLPKANVAGV